MAFVRVAVLALVAAVSGVNAIDADTIPHDKCGVTTFVNDASELELYALGEDRTLLHKRQLCTGGWTKWTSMGGAFTSGPQVIMNFNHEAEVFIIGADKTLWHKRAVNRNSTQFTAFRTMGGHFSSPPTVTTDSEGLIHVFVRGMDRALWHKMQKRLDDGTLGWHDWNTLGGTLTSSPQALVDSEGLVHVFARGMNRALLHKQTVFNETYHVSWTAWESLGGNLASAPKSVALGDSVNFLEVFARAADKGLWRKRQVLDPENVDFPVKWSVWEALGGVFSSGPSAIVNSNGNLDVFSRGTDKAVWHKQQILSNDEGNEDWTSWTSLGGIVSTTPTVAKEEEGLVHVFARGVDRAIWAKYQVRGANSTVSWTPWYSLGARTLKYNC
jgi:hypothetical protein